MKRCIIFSLGLLLLAAPAGAAPAPYVPLPGDLAPQDQPGEAARRRVRQNIPAYQGAAEGRQPASPPRSASPPPPRNASVAPTAPAFTPKPYIPDDPAFSPPAPHSPSRATSSSPAGSSAGAGPISPASVAPPATSSVGSGQTPPASVAPPAGSSAGAGPTPPASVAPPPALRPSSSRTADGRAVPQLLEGRLKGIMGAYRAKDWDIILTFLHPQVYVLMRSPKGEQGTLGHKQLSDAYRAQIDSASTPSLRLLENKVELIKADRAKMWARMEATVRRDDSHTVNLAVILELDWLRENNAWLITDAIIQHDAP